MKLKLALALAIAVSTPALAYGGWTLIGTRQVLDRTDYDSVVLPGPRDFRQIKICAYRNAVDLKDVDVHFANGGHQDISVAARLGKGECTRDIDLEGADRNITRIDLKYDAASPGRGRATVKIFGRG
jgi:hypothetical protein